MFPLWRFSSVVGAALVRSLWRNRQGQQVFPLWRYKLRLQALSVFPDVSVQAGGRLVIPSPSLHTANWVMEKEARQQAAQQAARSIACKHPACPGAACMHLAYPWATRTIGRGDPTTGCLASA